MAPEGQQYLEGLDIDCVKLHEPLERYSFYRLAGCYRRLVFEFWGLEISMENRIVLIGAGSAQFGYGTIGDILQSKVLDGSHIVLLDINPETVSAVGKKA